MFTEILVDDDHVVGIACNGKLTKEEFERMRALAHVDGLIEF